MPPGLAARETYVAETNLAAQKQENVFASGQKHFSFPNINFASETYVSQFIRAGNMFRKQILLLGNKKMFLPQVKNTSASRTQILFPK